MIRFVLFLLILVCPSCQKNESPEEIVRIVPGKSLMEQIAPAMNRQKQGKNKIYLVQDSVTADELEKHLKEDAKKRNQSKYQVLYISGQKAKDKKAQQEQLQKKLENSKVSK